MNVKKVIAALFEGVIPYFGPAFREIFLLVTTQQSQDRQSDALPKINEIVRFNKDKNFDVIAITASNYDTFLKVDKIAPDHECEVESKNSFECPGGSGANTIAGLSKLGKKTAIVSCVKNDSEGKKIIQSFENLSADVQFLIQVDDPSYPPTGKTIVLVEDSGKRQILVNPGINNCLAKIIRERGLLNDLIDQVRNSKILHLSSFTGKDEMELQLLILEAIKDSETIVSLTPGALYVEKGLDRLKPILARTNILFLYTQQLERLLEQSGIKNFKKNLSIREKTKLFFEWKIKQRMGHPMVLVVKDNLQIKSHQICENYISVASSIGKSLGFFSHSNVSFNIGSKANILLDTTGAGDAVAAGFLYGVLEGESIETCADLGFILATHVSRNFGARAGQINESSLRLELKNLTRSSPQLLQGTRS